MRMTRLMTGLTVFAGTLLLWIPRMQHPERTAWPTVLATAGFWLLGGLLLITRRWR